MRAHRTDLVSFAFGLLFLALVAWWLLAQVLGFVLPPVGWFLAGGLILIGLLGLLGALRSSRPDEPRQPGPDTGAADRAGTVAAEMTDPSAARWSESPGMAAEHSGWPGSGALPDQAQLTEGEQSAGNTTLELGSPERPAVLNQDSPERPAVLDPTGDDRTLDLTGDNDAAPPQRPGPAT